jgi:hypothetical protein
MMWPDITTIIPSTTGLRTVIYNVVITMGPVGPIGGKLDWDVFGYLYTKDDDDPSIPEKVAVSIAVKGSMGSVARKLARGSVVSVSGKFGEIETSSSGRETFRRIFCSVHDVKLLRRAK